MPVKRNRAQRLAIDFFFDIASALVYAISINCFIAPNKIAPGGISGVSIMLNYLFSLPIGTTTFCINIPLLLLAWRFLGREFTARSLKTVFIQSVTIDLLQHFLPIYHGERILAGLFGGIGVGFALSLVFMRGSTTGGVDIISRLIQMRYRHIPIGKLMLIVDGAVLFASALVYRDIEASLYGLISIYATSSIIDRILFGLNTGKVLLIVSPLYREITNNIMNRVNRGVTFLKAQGAYSGTDQNIVLCAVRAAEYYKVLEIIRESDPDAFTITLQANEILGSGFRLISEDSVT